METKERKKKRNELYEQEMTGALENVYGKQDRLDKEKDRKVKEDETLREESLLLRESEVAIKEAEIIRFNIEQSTEVSILGFSILLIIGLILLYFSYFLISTVLKEIFFSINPNCKHKLKYTLSTGNRVCNFAGLQTL